jgi:alkyl hydroperoxide reductase subunit AhpC
MKKGEVPMPFPIVFDAEGKLSKGLGVFNAEWGGSKVDQNMASEFIIDKDGIVQFKYIGQNTWDRPSYEFLWKVLGWINTCK